MNDQLADKMGLCWKTFPAYLNKIRLIKKFKKGFLKIPTRKSNSLLLLDNLSKKSLLSKQTGNTLPETIYLNELLSPEHQKQYKYPSKVERIGRKHQNIISLSN